MLIKKIKALEIIILLRGSARVKAKEIEILTESKAKKKINLEKIISLR